MADRVKQRSNGRLIIQYLGGPEVVPAAQLAEAVRKNVVQIGLDPVEYYETLVQLGNMLALSQLSPDEERVSGAYDFINEQHKKAGLFYLERATANLQPYNFSIITNKWVDTPKGLLGQKIGAATNISQPLFQRLGIALTMVPVPEFYTALERGVVDGVSDPITNHVTNQLFQVAKYVVDPPYFCPASVFIVNLDSWNKLPPDLQALLTSVARELINEYMNDFDKEVANARKLVVDKGMKFTNFSDADKEWFINNVYDASWEDVMKRYPENTTKLRPLITKK